jgi:hypothetical protein
MGAAAMRYGSCSWLPFQQGIVQEALSPRQGTLQVKRQSIGFPAGQVSLFGHLTRRVGTAGAVCQ